MGQGESNVADAHGAPRPKNGRLFIISAPSGAGKTTLCRALLNHFQDMIYSVSSTTRKPREGENDGTDYFFISREEFLKRIEKDQWAEWAVVHGNYYGTSADYLNSGLFSGKDILLDIDVQGTAQILKRYPESITIFIAPPSFEVLKERMTARGTDSEEIMEERLRNAKEELEQKDLYRHIIVNDNLEDAVSELISVVESYLTFKK